MPMPSVGALAPDFELTSHAEQRIRLSALRGFRVVLFFYPKADTPGCTTEACGFRDAFQAYQERSVIVLGVSPDGVRDQARFGVKHSLPFPLLADVDHAVCKAYGVWGPKRFMGKDYMGVHRTTFVIDETGRVAFVFENVKPEGHSGEVLAVL